MNFPACSNNPGDRIHLKFQFKKKINLIVSLQESDFFGINRGTTFTWITIFVFDFIINMILEILIDAMINIWICHIRIQILLDHVSVIVDRICTRWKNICKKNVIILNWVTTAFETESSPKKNQIDQYSESDFFYVYFIYLDWDSMFCLIVNYWAVLSYRNPLM